MGLYLVLVYFSSAIYNQRAAELRFFFSYSPLTKFEINGLFWALEHMCLEY